MFWISRAYWEISRFNEIRALGIVRIDLDLYEIDIKLKRFEYQNQKTKIGFRTIPMDSCTDAYIPMDMLEKYQS